MNIWYYMDLNHSFMILDEVNTQNLQ